MKQQKSREDELRMQQKNKKRISYNEQNRKRMVQQEEKKHLKETKRGNAQIFILTYVTLIIFTGLIGYFSFFVSTQSKKIINNPYNKRQQVLAKKIRKGKIISADGKILAETKKDSKGEDVRVYPYNKVFCHVVGRSTKSMTGIEANECYTLLTSHMNPFIQLTNTFRGDKNPGDNVITTLDSKLQQAAYDALQDYKGAAVAIEPSTGKILAMVSKPAYDPNTVSKNWASLIKNTNDDSKLINRATQGLYPPGSTFKMLTAMEYLQENPQTYDKFRYSCEGSASFRGNIINCYEKEKHGYLNIKKAFAKSCNCAFAQMGTKLDIASFRKLNEKFKFNSKLPVDFEYSKSRFVLTDKSDMGELTQTVMGQGKTVITPLENALIGATIANGGTMMTPYVVDHIENDDKKIITTNKPKSAGRIVEKWVADKMNTYMKAVVQEGTGRSLNNLPYKVAGKTGSAEFDSQGRSHAWFVGYAPADNPKIAISVVVESSGTGSQYAIPVVKKMLSAYKMEQ